MAVVSAITSVPAANWKQMCAAVNNTVLHGSFRESVSILYPVFIITMYKEFHSFSMVRYFTGYYYQYFDTRHIIWLWPFFFDECSAKTFHLMGNGGRMFR
jgi:hypothetical protein